MPAERPFKTCKICAASWATRDQFIADPEIVLVGYQANFVELEKGLFLFNHACQSTLTVGVETFADMYSGPIYQERLTGSETCAGYCLQRDELQACTAKCECAYVREIMVRLQDRAIVTQQVV